MYVVLTLSVIGILRKAGSVYAERIGRGFLEEIKVEILRRGMKEETPYRPRKQCVLPLNHNTRGRMGPVECMVRKSEIKMKTSIIWI